MAIATAWPAKACLRSLLNISKGIVLTSYNAMNSRQILNNLKSLKEEWQNDRNATEKEMRIKIDLVDSFIRSHEIVIRVEEYYRNQYYFGYLLIQSQRIESTMKPLIFMLERYKAKQESRNEALSETDLEIPLGPLIKKLKLYISSDVLFFELKKFKDFRNKIIHKIDKDLSISLPEIENSILIEYPFDSINRLQGMLIRIYKILDSSTFNIKAIIDFEKEFGLQDIDVRIL